MTLLRKNILSDCETPARCAILSAMETVLVFATSAGKAQSTMQPTGIRAFAQGTDWNVQAFAFEGTDFPVRELLRFWKPAGCIVEGNGNGVTSQTIPPRAARTRKPGEPFVEV